MSPDLALEVAGLTVRYPDGARAVRGVSLAIGAGRTVALVGESGCGKSTIAQAILGTLPRGSARGGELRLGPSAGEPGLALHALDGRAMRAVRGRRIGYVAQNPYRACDPLRRVAHHVDSAWTVHGARPPGGAAAGLIARLGIDDAERRLRRRPHEWSGGMLQRASIAAAHALHPQLIIADEPTSALDSELARATLQTLRATDAAILLITHDIALAMDAAEDVHVLYAGEIVESGPTAEVLARPRHPYTQALLRAIPRPGGGMPEPLAGASPDPRAERGGCAFAPRCALADRRCDAARPSLEGGIACLRAPS